MYKVFFNDSTIQVASQNNLSSKNNISRIIEDLNYDSVNQMICEIENSQSQLNILIKNQDVNEVWSQFKKCFKKIPAAGGLVQNMDGLYLFIRRLGVWDLPKGKIEKKESPEHAAVREVEEECGLSGIEIVKPLESTFHIYRSPYMTSPKNLVLKETKWFYMRYSGKETPIPEFEEQIEEVRWFDVSELDEVKSNTYSNIIDFLENSLKAI